MRFGPTSVHLLIKNRSFSYTGPAYVKSFSAVWAR
jgi:hypothetical protein